MKSSTVLDRYSNGPVLSLFSSFYSFLSSVLSFFFYFFFESPNLAKKKKTCYDVARLKGRREYF